MSEKICYICGEEASTIFKISKDKREYVCNKCREKYFKPEEDKE